MSHRTVRKPTEEERAELKRMKRQEVGRVAMRAHIILLSSRGHSAHEIAELHSVTHPMVYKWIGRFDEEGPSGLFDREREGRPRKIDEEAEKEIERLLETGPPTEQSDATRWTPPRLAEHLKRELGIDVHPETVREALKRLEYSWTRPRRQLRKGPDYEERLVQLDKAVATAGAETTHTSGKVKTFLDGVDRIETLLLPKRAPEANPMEDLWRELKRQVAACLERSLGALVASCRRYFEALSPEEALRTAGIGYK